jgi:signal transduction histidine kinase
MDRLLTDIRDYAQAGKDSPNVDQCDVALLLDDVLEFVNVPDGFTVRVTPPMPTLKTAKLPLKRVFLNLIDNAIKHHDGSSGSVSISAVEAKDPRFLEFRVCDDGPGIPGRFQKKVFQMFQTLRPRDSVEGSGMGLTIAKTLVESIGGSLTLESKGRGATFSFTWPKSLIEKSRRVG